MKKNALKELYIDELRDIYSAENQLTKALPKMAKAGEEQPKPRPFLCLGAPACAATGLGDPLWWR